MAFDGKSTVRFVDFSKEPLGWPPSDVENLIDIRSVETSNPFRGLLADDSSGPAAAINNSTGERTLMFPDNVDFTFSNMGVLSEMGSGGLESDLPNTSISALETPPFPSTSSWSPTIRIENPEGIRVPFQTACYEQIFEPSNKWPKLDNRPSSTRPQHNPYTTFGSPDVTPQQSNIPIDNHILSSPNTTNSVDYTGALPINSPVGLAPASVTHDELSRNSLPPDPGYVTSSLSLYSNNFFIPGFQNPVVNTSQSKISSSPSTSDYLDLTLPSGTSPVFPNLMSSASEFSCDTPQGEFTPFLDLQTEQRGIISSDLSFSSGHSAHPSNGGMGVMDVEARNESPIMSISRPFRHRHSPSNNDNNPPNSKFVPKYAPLIPIPLEHVSEAHPYTSSLSPNSTLERTPYSSPSVDSNILNNNSQIGGKINVSEDHSFISVGPLRIKPILVQPFQKRQDKKTIEGVPVPEAPPRRSKSSQGQRQSKKFCFRPICPSISYQTRVNSLSPLPSPSAVDPPRANPQSPVSPSIISSVPSDTSFISTLSNSQAEYLSNIPFNKIAPTSGVEVANRITGVAFSELKQLQFGFSPVSEILEDSGSKPFSGYDRMTELSVLVEWSFSSGLEENNQLHKIVKLDRPINNLRRVEILCKIARKLYEYIQREATIPLDPKKLCILSLCQRLDKKWIVRIGLNNSQRG